MPRRGRKYTVEDCDILDMAELLKQIVAQPVVRWQGSVRWAHRNSLAFWRDEHPLGGPSLVLGYSVKHPTQRRGRFYYREYVSIAEIPQPFGGVRLRGRCPGCCRAVDHLYRPPYSQGFRCRRCHKLGYLNRHRRRASYRETLDLAEAVGSSARLKRWIKEEEYPDMRRRIAPEPPDPTSREPRGYVRFRKPDGTPA